MPRRFDGRRAWAHGWAPGACPAVHDASVCYPGPCAFHAEIAAWRGLQHRLPKRQLCRRVPQLGKAVRRLGHGNACGACAFGVRSHAPPGHCLGNPRGNRQYEAAPKQKRHGVSRYACFCHDGNASHSLFPPPTPPIPTALCRYRGQSLFYPFRRAKAYCDAAGVHKVTLPQS